MEDGLMSFYVTCGKFLKFSSFRHIENMNMSFFKLTEEIKKTFCAYGSSQELQWLGNCEFLENEQVVYVESQEQVECHWQEYVISGEKKKKLSEM